MAMRNPGGGQDVRKEELPLKPESLEFCIAFTAQKYDWFV